MKKDCPNYIEKMNFLIQYLPEKDKNLANKFMANREFEKLYDLVLSTIRIYERALKNKSNLNISDDSLQKQEELLAEITSYLEIINPSWLLEGGNEWYDDANDTNEEEEF